jgi:putative transposase
VKLVNKVRMYPTVEQSKIFDLWIDRCRYLYNVALQQRIYHYEYTGKSLNVYEQKKELTLLKEVLPEWKDIPNKPMQDVLFRLEKSFKSFFSRGFKGFPKFKSKNYFHSIVFVKTDVRIKNNQLFFPKIKECIKFRGDIPSQFSSVILKRNNKRYFACFVYDFESIETAKDNTFTSIDLGLKSLYTTNTGKSLKRCQLRCLTITKKELNN